MDKDRSGNADRKRVDDQVINQVPLISKLLDRIIKRLVSVPAVVTENWGRSVAGLLDRSD